MAYDASKRKGWAKGLIHFHTNFSDGGATVPRAVEIARSRGYDFLIITDHLQNLPRQGHHFEEYVNACKQASSPDLLVIPGGEIEINWARNSDHSEAHTLAMSIAPLLSELVWSPATKPYAHWRDSRGCEGTILATQEKLQAVGVPPAASHQFQHAYLGTSIHPDEHSDYRYDLRRIANSPLLDFFYSGVVDAAHEPEDFALYLSRLNGPRETLPAIYSSCDYHYGPETVRELIRQHEEEGIAGICKLLIAWRKAFGRILCFLLRVRPSLAVRLVEWLLPTILNTLKKLHILQFADEQLSHTTYVYIGSGPLSEDTVIQGLREGRTCVTRGEAEFQNLQPVPSNVPVRVSRVELQLSLPRTYSVHRPRSILIYRDGSLADWLTVPDEEQSISKTWLDPVPIKGVHNYVIYIPSKFLSSPILVDVQAN